MMLRTAVLILTALAYAACAPMQAPPGSSVPGPSAGACEPTPDAPVALFTHIAYAGSCRYYGPGTIADMSTHEGVVRAASSIKVGDGWRAYLCDSGGMAGNCEAFEGDVPNLSKRCIGHDNVASIAVEPTSAPGRLVAGGAAAKPCGSYAKPAS